MAKDIKKRVEREKKRLRAAYDDTNIIRRDTPAGSTKKEETDAVRKGTWTIGNTYKTKESIQKTRIRSKEDRDRIATKKAYLIKRIEQIINVIGVTRHNRIIEDKRQLKLAQKSGDRQAVEDAKRTIIETIMFIIEKDGPIEKEIMRINRESRAVLDEIELLIKSYKDCLGGIRENAASMLTNTVPFFTSLLNLCDRSQFFSEDQLMAMDISELILDNARERAENRRQANTLRLPATEGNTNKDDPDKDSNHRGVFSKKDVAVTRSTLSLINKKSNEIPKKNKAHMETLYEKCSKSVRDKMEGLSERKKNLETSVADFEVFIDKLCEELEKNDTLTTHRHRTVVEC